MKEAFIERRFTENVRLIIDAASKIITRYQAMGVRLTGRSLYYRFIAMDLFPASWIDPVYNAKNNLHKDTKNTFKNYKRLANIINDARLAGLIDWYGIEDLTRATRGGSGGYESPDEFIEESAGAYHEHLWADQPVHCEVWVEKDALIGVLESPCSDMNVAYMSTRGYVSQTAAYDAGKRFRRFIDAGKEVVVFYFSDHDPSGLDMARDLEDRLMMFGRTNSINFQRLALTMGQIEQYDPPPNPAKETDSRFEGYSQEHGDSSWELDALEPEVMQELIKDAILTVVDRPKWNAAIKHQDMNREVIQKLADNWEDVKNLLDGIQE